MFPFSALFTRPILFGLNVEQSQLRVIGLWIRPGKARAFGFDHMICYVKASVNNNLNMAMLCWTVKNCELHPYIMFVCTCTYVVAS